MFVPLADASELQALQVPSGTATLPLRTATVSVVLVGSVEAQNSASQLALPASVSRTDEVNVPLVTYGGDGSRTMRPFTPTIQPSCGEVEVRMTPFSCDADGDVYDDQLVPL